jgi:hypothetical protein
MQPDSANTANTNTPSLVCIDEVIRMGRIGGSTPRRTLAVAEKPAIQKSGVWNARAEVPGLETCIHPVAISLTKTAKKYSLRFLPIEVRVVYAFIP